MYSSGILSQNASLVLPQSKATNFKEDLSSLSIMSSHFVTEKAVLGEADRLPTLTRELVRVQWRTGDPIYLFVLLPKGVTKPAAVLYLYGYPAETDRFRDPSFCELLTRNGVAAIGFVSAFTAQRYHDRPMRQWFLSELREALVTSTHDVQMILNYLAGRGDIDMDRLAMFGEGSGATIAVFAATADSRLKAVDLLDPWGDWPDWMAHSSLVPKAEQANFLKPEFLSSLKSLDLVDVLPNLKIPIRLEYLNPHGLTPSGARARIVQAAPPQAQIVPTEKGVAEYRTTLGQKFLDWIQEQARGPLARRIVSAPASTVIPPSVF